MRIDCWQARHKSGVLREHRHRARPCCSGDAAASRSQPDAVKSHWDAPAVGRKQFRYLSQAGCTAVSGATVHSHFDHGCVETLTPGLLPL
eukprot:COSAG01_NODE_2014_length_8644_cov_70.285079_7_plen_90_part_00